MNKFDVDENKVKFLAEKELRDELSEKYGYTIDSIKMDTSVDKRTIHGIYGTDTFIVDRFFQAELESKGFTRIIVGSEAEQIYNRYLELIRKHATQYCQPFACKNLL